jgi:hypothetical protein
MDNSIYYRLIKLINGEVLIAQTDDPCDDWLSKPIISVLNPILMQSMRFPKGDSLIETYILHPWVSFAEDEVIDIPTRNILVILNPEQGLITNYEEYIMRSSGNNEPSTDEEEPSDFDSFLDSLRGEGEQHGEEENDNEGFRSSGGSTRILH